MKHLTTAEIWTQAEKAVSKTPQTALPGTLDRFDILLLLIYHPVLSHFFRIHPDPRAVKVAINAARSANEGVRRSSIELFNSLPIARADVPVEDFITALKSATPEHRSALLVMVSHLPPAKGIAAAALGKGDVHMGLTPHVVYALEHEEPKEVLKLMEDGLKSPRWRRSYFSLVGDVLWNYSGKDAKNLETELEKTLKAGGFEGCVATAVLLRRTLILPKPTISVVCSLVALQVLPIPRKTPLLRNRCSCVNIRSS